MKYKIGDVARILGISPDLLRYYEKKGIVHPVKDAHNDYRYYEAWDINFLMDCIWYKSFHFGIDQVAEIITDSTAEEVAQAVQAEDYDWAALRAYRETYIETAQKDNTGDITRFLLQRIPQHLRKQREPAEV